jgi:tRNA pseudouridine55 synthase
MGKTEISGLVLLDKPPGLTSFQAVRELSNILGLSKAGHTGTLDKFASGLLVILSGRALKLAPWFSNLDKEYEGSILFGAETDTLDPEGEVIFQAPLPTEEAVLEALPQFRGEFQQTPPSYSAIHLDGKRAYERVRAGEAVEMKNRPVTIHDLELLSYHPPLAEIRVSCSKGTYIRSLARDLGLAAGSRGSLSSLRRKRVGGFSLEDAFGLEALREVRPVDTAVFDALGIPVVEIFSDDVSKIIHGTAPGPILEPLVSAFRLPPGTTGLEEIQEKRGGVLPVGLFAGAEIAGRNFLGIAERREGRWTYGYVYAGS